MGLTNYKIKSAAIGKRHHDGCGLCRTLSAHCRGKWTIRYMINRKAKEIGVGRYPELLLAYVCSDKKTREVIHYQKSNRTLKHMKITFSDSAEQIVIGEFLWYFL